MLLLPFGLHIELNVCCGYIAGYKLTQVVVSDLLKGDCCTGLVRVCCGYTAIV
jgi:hypothetical protein